MDKPLHIPELREKVARKMWEVCRSSNDPLEPPLATYVMAEVAIKEIYGNVDKILLETIRNRLEGLI
jgi:hypothetical protein